MTIDVFGPANAINAVTARPFDGRAFGVLDTWMKDCSSAASQDGTQILAAMLNEFIANFRSIARVNGLKADGITPVVTQDNGDDLLLRGIGHLIQRGVAFAFDMGSVNAIAASFLIPPAELKAGMRFTIVPANSNTSSTVTVTSNGLTTRLKKCNGSDPAVGDVQAGVPIDVLYNGTNLLLIEFATSDILTLIYANSVTPLTANATIYVAPSPTGSNLTGDGTAAKPFGTILYAINYAVKSYDFAGYILTVKLATPGVYAAPGNTLSWGGAIVVQGDVTNQAAYIISGGNIAGASSLIGTSSGFLNLMGVTVQNTGTLNHGVGCTGATISLTNVGFVTTVTSTLACIFSSVGGNVIVNAGCIFTGSWGWAWYSLSGSIVQAASVSFSGSFAASVAVVSAIYNGSIVQSAGGWTMSGSATGVRYSAYMNGTIQSNNGSTTYFLGSVAGTTATGGQYT